MFNILVDNDLGRDGNRDLFGSLFFFLKKKICLTVFMCRDLWYVYLTNFFKGSRLTVYLDKTLNFYHLPSIAGSKNK